MEGDAHKKMRLPLVEVTEHEVARHSLPRAMGGYNGKLAIIPVTEYERLQRTAAKSTRRRAALKQHMKAYDSVVAENARLRSALQTLAINATI